MQRIILILLRVFFVWLLLHFFMHTWITFGWWIQAGPLRAWKEIVVGLLAVSVGWCLIFGKKNWKEFFSNKEFIQLLVVFALWIISTAYIHTVIVGESRKTWAMAMRYDYLGFLLLFLWRALSFILWKQKTDILTTWYSRLIKRVLVVALIRRCIAAIKPWTMKLFWFNNYVFEWTVWLQPPAVYYTHINYWLPRSQFFFERPTTFWFWLTAFFPIFFIQFLYRRPIQQTWWWRTIYGLNIILTFSRAAWGSWIIAVVIAIGRTSKLPWKKLVVRYGLPLLALFGAILRVGREQIALRWYSNYGHMTMVKRGVDMLMQKPLRGWWWASVWPWSHWDGGLAFNPENQFLQILIEFGKLWAIPWLILRGWCVLIGLRAGVKKEQLFAYSLGMVTLTISGMVLHSFADRMVVYPFMLLFGMAVWAHMNSERLIKSS